MPACLVLQQLDMHDSLTSPLAALMLRVVHPPMLHCREMICISGALQRGNLELTDLKLQLASCLGFSRWQYFVTLAVSIGADRFGCN